MADFDVYRNDAAARVELTNQARAMTLIRPLASILNSHLTSKFELGESDIVAAIMWLFDNMLYFETRNDCHGTTRLEAESILVEHFSEAHPDWESDACINVARDLFQFLTPNNIFRYDYYDFTQKSHQTNHFRLIEWKPTEKNGVLYNLSEEGLILYTTRLEDRGLEHATVAAMRAQRTIRRGEIAYSIELAQQIIRDMKSDQLKINTMLRAARMHDISFTFADKLEPVIDDSYDLLIRIMDLTADTLRHITDMRKGCSLEEVRRLREAQVAFDQIRRECREFKGNLATVQQRFIESRVEVIAQKNNPTATYDLTQEALKPLLEIPTEILQENIDRIVSFLLPPALRPKSKREAPFCFDLKSSLSILETVVNKGGDENIKAVDAESEEYVAPRQYISDRDVAFANRWIDEHLDKYGEIYFEHVIEEYKAGRLTEEQARAGLFVIGAEATSGKEVIKVLIDGQFEYGDWSGDNLGIAISCSQSKHKQVENG